MTKGEPHIDYSKFDTVALGNRMAQQIIAKGPQPNYDATIRHTLNTAGVHDATALASQLLGIDYAAACMVIARLANTKPDNIVSPHEQND